MTIYEYILLIVLKGETSQVVAAKTKNAIDAGMSVMVCIGEQLADRQNGSTMTVCAEQLDGTQQ